MCMQFKKINTKNPKELIMCIQKSCFQEVIRHHILPEVTCWESSVHFWNGSKSDCGCLDDWSLALVRVREKNSPSQEGCPGCECALTDQTLQQFCEGHLCWGAKRMWSWDCPSVIQVFCIPQVVIQLRFLYFLPSLREDWPHRWCIWCGFGRREGVGSDTWCSYVVVDLVLHPDVPLLYFLHFQGVG